MVFANVRKVVKIVPPPPPPPLPPDHAHMEVLLVMKVCMFRLNHGIQSRSAAARRRARDLPARILTRGGRLERWCGVESAVRPGAGAVDSMDYMDAILVIIGACFPMRKIYKMRTNLQHQQG